MAASMPATRRPCHRPRRRHRRRHRRQQPRAPSRAARLARHRADRQGPAAQPGRLHRARVELHLPGRPLPRAGRPHPRLGAPVQGAGRVHRVGRLRGRPLRGADGGAAPPDVVGPGVGRTGRAGDAGPRRRARPVPGEGQDPRRVLVPVGRRGRLAARGHVVPRVRAGARRAHRAVDRRGGRHGRRAGPDPAGAHHRRRHRGRDRRDRVRRVEPEAGEDGGRVDPAHPGRAPDDLGGADPAARRAAGRDLVPDRPRHGHVLLRAPARRRHGGGLLRPPPDPPRRRRDPVDRAVEALPHRAAVHGRRLRPPARAGLRAHAGRARRRGGRDPLRDQRPAVADPGRRRRCSGRRPRSRACGRRPPCGSRRARASGGPSPSG